MTALNLIPGQLSLAQLRDIYQQPVKITLDDCAMSFTACTSPSFLP